MTGRVSLSFRTSPETAAALEKLAKATDRQKSWHIERALEDYVAQRSWEIEHIQEGLRDLAEGRYVEHERVMEWVKSWGTEHELPMPEPRKK